MHEFLIVGQGLAGSLLAWELIQAGRDVMVVDNAHRHASSRVAAGLINPVTGMRMVLAPQTAAWLEAADALYGQLQGRFAITLRHQLPMWRVFTEEKQRQAWQERLAEAAYRPYLSVARDAEQALPYLAPLGFGEVSSTGYIDTKLLLATLREWLSAQQAYVERECRHEDIRIDGEGVELGGLRARRLIFCEGYRAVDNPWFGQLPLTPVKGEILTLEIEPPLPGVISNFGKWVVPVSQRQFKLGATYDWQHRDLEPTARAREHLLEALAAYTRGPLKTQVVSHEVGLRPNSRDRLPLIGRHPEEPSLWIFNGFGSRGSLMIPYYARQLRRHLLQGVELEPHCDIARYR